MIVYILTIEQADTLRGKEFTKDMLFNPTLDADENWFISIEEVNQCDVAEFAWVKDLPQIEHKPKVIKFP